ncbi:hypothetical protein ACFL27_19595, partial [candidate division CSSED10-310 bacterium]
STDGGVSWKRANSGIRYYISRDHNEQSTEFVVVQNEEIIHKIALLSAKYLEKLANNFKNPIGRSIMRFSWVSVVRDTLLISN